MRRTYEGLRKRRLDEFMSAFNTISLKLKEMYQMITLGGDAELELVDSLDPFSEVRILHRDPFWRICTSLGQYPLFGQWDVLVLGGTLWIRYPNDYAVNILLL